MNESLRRGRVNFSLLTGVYENFVKNHANESRGKCIVRTLGWKKKEVLDYSSWIRLRNLILARDETGMHPQMEARTIHREIVLSCVTTAPIRVSPEFNAN